MQQTNNTQSPRQPQRPSTITMGHHGLSSACPKLKHVLGDDR